MEHENCTSSETLTFLRKLKKSKIKFIFLTLFISLSYRTVSLYELIAIIIIDFNLTYLVAKLYLITFTEVSYEVVFVSSQLIIPN
jgi:hypothetical protein